MMIRANEMKVLLHKLYGPNGVDFTTLKISREYRAACELAELCIVKICAIPGTDVAVSVERVWNARKGEVGTIGQAKDPVPANVSSTTAPAELPPPVVEQASRTKIVEGGHEMYLNEDGEWRCKV